MTHNRDVIQDAILTRVAEESFERGRDYYETGMVESVIQRGERLFSEALCSAEDPYHVSVNLQKDDFSAF